MKKDDKFKKPITSKEREEYAKKYTPLVYKIANQNKDKLPLSYDDILGFGFLGLTKAMNTYKDDTGQTFTQYAAYQIYYNILCGANNEGHIVKFSAYQQEKAKKENKSTFIWQRMVSTARDEDGCENYDTIFPPVKPQSTTLPDTLEHLEKFVKENCKEKDVDIFFSTFGLAGHKEVTGVELAKKYGVSSAAITYGNRRVINTIRKNQELYEELEELLEN